MQPPKKKINKCLMFFFSVRIADGFALGAAVATGQMTVQVIVFFAVILHKVRLIFSTNHRRHVIELLTQILDLTDFIS